MIRRQTAKWNTRARGASADVHNRRIKTELSINTSEAEIEETMNSLRMGDIDVGLRVPRTMMSPGKKIKRSETLFSRSKSPTPTLNT